VDTGWTVHNKKSQPAIVSRVMDGISEKQVIAEVVTQVSQTHAMHEMA
jgi:hypothetical protein